MRSVTLWGEAVILCVIDKLYGAPRRYRKQLPKSLWVPKLKILGFESRTLATTSSKEKILLQLSFTGLKCDN